MTTQSERTAVGERIFGTKTTEPQRVDMGDTLWTFWVSSRLTESTLIHLLVTSKTSDEIFASSFTSREWAAWIKELTS